VSKRQQQKGTPKKSKRRSPILTWVIVLAIAVAAIYGLTRMSNVAFDEDDIKVVNFQGLTDRQKQAALEEANAARCTCGCGLGLAQCVSTDPNCPIREGNIDRIKGMVRAAASSD
jgi:hypothetical protein